MNIQREFLYNEDKYIPLQLLTSNYGLISEGDAPSIFDEGAVESKQFEVVFPRESSNIAFTIDNTEQDPTIVEVRSAPPGVSSVFMTIEEGRTLEVYVISKEYQDGFIQGDYTVAPDPLSADRLQVTYDNAPQRINLNNDGAMTESKGRDENDFRQWYGYDGFYEGPLVWSAPTINGEEFGFANYWIVARGEILSQIENILHQNDVYTFNALNKGDVVKVYKVMDDLAEFMQDKRQYYDDLLGDDASKIEDIWSFINTNLPGFNVGELHNDSYYLTYDNPVGQWVDELAVYADYVRWDFWNNGSYPQADQAGQFVAATNQERDDSFTYTFEGQTRRYGLMGLDSADRHKGIYGGGKEARALISGIWGRIGWSAARSGGSNGIFDPNFAPAWNEFREQKSDWVQEINSLLETQYAIPRHDYTGNQTELNQNWWEGVTNYSQSKHENLLGWLQDQITENIRNMAVAGNSIFNVGGTEVITGYSALDLTVMPDWWNVQVPWESFTVRRTEEIPRENGVYTAEWIWNELVDQQILRENRESWNRAIQFDLDGNDIRIWEDRNTHIRTTTRVDANWDIVVRYINENMDRLWIPQTGIITGSTVSGETTPDVEYFPQAQEAILQNIRYVKDLLNSVDENLWSALNNTSAIMLATLIDLKRSQDEGVDTHSILNITNSTVRTSDIEVLWQKVGETGWTPIENALSDIGGNVKMLSLNFDQFRNTGKYVFMLRPRTYTVNVIGTDGNYAMVRDELNAFRDQNSLYGYNAQPFNADGEQKGEQKIVIDSRWHASIQYIKLSPIKNQSEIVENDKLQLWANTFIPMLIEVDIVEHNALTLSYAAYAKKELNLDTGMCTIYDHNGNVYKELSLGRHSNLGTGGAIVEYRVPAVKSYTDEY